MSQHTEGPWTAIEKTGPHVGRVTSNEGKTIAFMAAMNPLSDYNGRLIAAAPEMLEALLVAKELADVMKGLTSGRSDDEWVWAAQAKINAAISKAKIPTKQPR